MSQSEDATPDGAAETQPTTEDLIPRSEAAKAFAARDEAKARARELEAELARLREQAAQPKMSTSKPKPAADAPPDWAAELLDRTRKLEAQLDGERRAKHRSQVTEAILGRLPAENRKIGGAVLDGLLARGELSLDGDDTSAIVDAAAKTLKTRHGELFRLAGSGSSALQVGPDGRIDWDSVKTAADVPPDAWRDMPAEVFDRLRDAGAGKRKGFLI